MRALRILSMVALSFVPSALAGMPLSAARADEKLPTDPALVRGTLPNGLTYLIRPHKNPEGRVSIWLHVGTGSLNETDATRGLAHYLEHMAFNGSANFPPGSVVPFFQSPNAPAGTLPSPYRTYQALCWPRRSSGPSMR